MSKPCPSLDWIPIPSSSCCGVYLKPCLPCEPRWRLGSLAPAAVRTELVHVWNTDLYRRTIHGVAGRPPITDPGAVAIDSTPGRALSLRRTRRLHMPYNTPTNITICDALFKIDARPVRYCCAVPYQLSACSHHARHHAGYRPAAGIWVLPHAACPTPLNIMDATKGH